MFGDPRLPERFWDKVSPEPNSGCWLWTAACNEYGYGCFYWSGRVRGAHRVSYSELVQDVPSGLQLDHLCRQRGCVNPLHLEIVSIAENLHRGLNSNREKTHCPAGHEYNGVNTYFWTDDSRRCRVCGRQNKRNRYYKRQNESNPSNNRQ